MSTVADVLPYMQDWLDARALLAPLVAPYATAKANAAAARTAIGPRVAAGDTAVAMTALVTTYVTARTIFLQQDTQQTAAIAIERAKYALFESMVELLAAGQPVPPFPVPVP